MERSSVFDLGPPYFEMWTADLDSEYLDRRSTRPRPNGRTSTSGKWWPFIPAGSRPNPQDAYAYSGRARCYDYLHDHGDDAQSLADMRRVGPSSSRDRPGIWPGDFRHAIDVPQWPIDRELVFSAERPVNEIPVMSVAFGQKGRCEMKLFEIPMFVTSLLGLCLPLRSRRAACAGGFHLRRAGEILGRPSTVIGNSDAMRPASPRMAWRCSYRISPRQTPRDIWVAHTGHARC